jgi:uncharacterized caspase-like protein
MGYLQAAGGLEMRIAIALGSLAAALMLMAVRDADAGSFALVVGVSQYQDPDIPQLHWADADAEEVAGLLHQSPDFTQDCVKLLVNSDATLRRITAALAELQQKCSGGAGGNAVVYFSGHAAYTVAGTGAPGANFIKDPNQSKEFLAPYDTDLQATYAMPDGTSANDTFIKKEWLIGTLSRLHADRVAMIIDACHSGMPDFQQLMSEYAATAPQSIPAASRSATLLSASGTTDVAYEFDELRHGTLTFALLSAINTERRAKPEAQLAAIAMDTLYSDVLSVFHAQAVKGKPLISYNSPEIYHYPMPQTSGVVLAQLNGLSGVVQAAPPAMPVTQVANVDTVQTREIPVMEPPHPANGRAAPGLAYLVIPATLPADGYVEIDGVPRTPAPDGSIAISAGRQHNVDIVIPSWNYRQVKWINLDAGLRSVVALQLAGELTIESADRDHPDAAGLQLAIAIDGQDYGQSNHLHLSDLHAGAHELRVSIAGVEKRTAISIRPESPLVMRYVVRKAVPAPDDNVPF